MRREFHIRHGMASNIEPMKHIPDLFDHAVGANSVVE